MANTHAIKARIKSVESIKQITRSMKMVAASKLRRVQAARGSLGIMADKSREMLEALLSSGSSSDDPLLQEREKKTVCYVLFVGNRGFCGVYNSALLHFLETQIAACEQASFVVVCGNWGQELIEPAGIPVRKRFKDISDVPNAEEAKKITEYLKKLYLEGEADEIVLVYQNYKSILQQQPGMRTLLPVKTEASGESTSEYLFEPDKETIIAALAELYVSNAVFSVLLESRMGEHAARMTSMTSASDSTEELIGELKQALNHARQAAITTEISEIVGGAAALNSSK